MNGGADASLANNVRALHHAESLFRRATSILESQDNLGTLVRFEIVGSLSVAGDFGVPESASELPGTVLDGYQTWLAHQNQHKSVPRPESVCLNVLLTHRHVVGSNGRASWASTGAYGSGGACAGQPLAVTVSKSSHIMAAADGTLFDDGGIGNSQRATKSAVNTATVLLQRNSLFVTTRSERGGRRPEAHVARTLAHELGHAVGASHPCCLSSPCGHGVPMCESSDADTACNPHAAPFLMHPRFTLSGPNAMRLSACSRREVATLIALRANRRCLSRLAVAQLQEDLPDCAYHVIERGPPVPRQLAGVYEPVHLPVVIDQTARADDAIAAQEASLAAAGSSAHEEASPGLGPTSGTSISIKKHVSGPIWYAREIDMYLWAAQDASGQGWWALATNPGTAKNWTAFYPRRGTEPPGRGALWFIHAGSNAQYALTTRLLDLKCVRPSADTGYGSTNGHGTIAAKPSASPSVLVVSTTKTKTSAAAITARISTTMAPPRIDTESPLVAKTWQSQNTARRKKRRRSKKSTTTKHTTVASTNITQRRRRRRRRRRRNSKRK